MNTYDYIYIFTHFCAKKDYELEWGLLRFIRKYWLP